MNKKKHFGRRVGRGLATSSLAWVLASASPAGAQPAPGPFPTPVQPSPTTTIPTPPPPPPTAPVPQIPTPTMPTQPALPPPPAIVQPAPGTAGVLTTTPSTASAPAKSDALAKALSKQPGGLTLEEVAKLAIKTRPQLRAKQAELKAAAAKVDQAYVNYFPRVSVAFSYTRLSEVDTALPVNTVNGQVPASLGTLLDPNQQAAPIVTAPCQQVPTANCVYAANPETGALSPVVASTQSLRFPLVLDAYSFTAQLAVPVSDYLLRITQGHSAASHAEKSKKIELEAETLTIAADAKIAFLNWARAKGQAIVAKEAVAQANAHLEDVKRLKTVGLASQADVLRVEAQVAAAEQAVVEVEAFAAIAEEQVRIGLGLPKDKSLALGIDLMSVAPPASVPALSEAQDKALQNRLEIRALDETELSLKDVESVTRAGYYPRVDAFAELNVANPNQRYIFRGAEWNTTWAAGVRASWTFNDTFTTIGAAAEAKARTTQIAETKKQVRDGLKLEVTAAWTDIKKAGASVDAATRSLTALEEALRVRRELYLQGKATNVEMLDAETEVTRARLRRLDAQIGLLAAQIRYDHAVGNDVGSQKAPDADAKNDETNGDDASVKKVTNVAKATPGPLLPLAK